MKEKLNVIHLCNGSFSDTSSNIQLVLTLLHDKRYGIRGKFRFSALLLHVLFRSHNIIKCNVITHIWIDVLDSSNDLFDLFLHVRSFWYSALIMLFC